MIRRRHPIRRGEPPKRTPLKRGRPDPAKNARWRKVRRYVVARSDGRCEAHVEGVCQFAGSHVHHVLPRGRGGPDDEWNLIYVCAPCHEYIHGHPIRAKELGLLR